MGGSDSIKSTSPDRKKGMTSGHPEEFKAKEIRLKKRSDRDHTTSSSSGSSSGGGGNTTPVTATHSQSGLSPLGKQEDFHCRPMRLGSRRSSGIVTGGVSASSSPSKSGNVSRTGSRNVSRRASSIQTVVSPTEDQYVHHRVAGVTVDGTDSGRLYRTESSGSKSEWRSISREDLSRVEESGPTRLVQQRLEQASIASDEGPLGPETETETETGGAGPVGPDVVSISSRDGSSSLDSVSIATERSVIVGGAPTGTTTTAPVPPSLKSFTSISEPIFAICLVNFHHHRGPEVQYWKSPYFPEYSPDLFRNLPFQALPDGSHLFEETFSNFNLVYDYANGESLDDGDDYNTYSSQVKNMRTLKTLFGCSCVQQVKTSDLSQAERDRNVDITRSIVQKAVVVISRDQPIFSKIKEKLSIITGCYFQQGDFSNFEILDSLFESLNNDSYGDVSRSLNVDDELFINLPLRQSILQFTSKFLVIYKALLLEKKLLIYSNTNLELLTQFQNNLISLVPNLISQLGLSGCPLLDYTELYGPLQRPDSLNTTNRNSLLRFFGLPLQIFTTKGSFWNPYLPLQQLNELSAQETRSYMIGCSNLLFVNQSEKLGVDILVNLDTNEITYPQQKKPEDLTLSSNDKKFINHLVKTCSNTNDPDAYVGSDDYIRHQFEDYLLSLLSTTRYSQYVDKFGQDPPGFNTGDQQQPPQSDNASDDSVETNNVQNGNLSLFNKKFVETWTTSTANFKIWNSMADEFMFNFLDPKHIGVGLDTNEPYFSSFFSALKGRIVEQSPPQPTIHKYVEEDKKIEEPEEGEDDGKDEENKDIEEDKNEESNPKQIQTGAENPLAKKISSWWYKKK
ncbi:hypothetical protein CAAN1_17S01266 [[Candida] anglica]|uniref:UDENN domain-containing protein n=1 Tax=[Candida] anglica TaxID=148631 RepID=A0ABP0E7I3_9ASCO